MPDARRLASLSSTRSAARPERRRRKASRAGQDAGGSSSTTRSTRGGEDAADSPSTAPTLGDRGPCLQCCSPVRARPLPLAPLPRPGPYARPPPRRPRATGVAVRTLATIRLRRPRVATNAWVRDMRRRRNIAGARGCPATNLAAGAAAIGRGHVSASPLEIPPLRAHPETLTGHGE